MKEVALPINDMMDGDAVRVANTLRQLNHALVGRQLPPDIVTQLADVLEPLVTSLGAENFPVRQRDFGVATATGSDAGSGFDYGAGTSLSYRPISGNCNALAAPAKYYRCEDESGEYCLKARLTFGPAFEGPPNLVHGGYVAAYMDEVFGIAISHSDLDVPAMTGTLKTIFRLPVPLHTELTYAVKMAGEERRKVFMHCTLKDDAGMLYAEGEAIFLKIDPSAYARMSGSE